MNVRMSSPTRSRVRREDTTPRRGGTTKPGRGRKSEMRGGKAAPKVIEAAPERRSGAAQRAYERRQQRAAIHVGDVTAPGVLPKRASKFAARIPFVASIIGLLSIGLALTLMLTTRSAEESYQLSAARSHNQDLIEQKASLERDVEAADSAPDLAAKARDLGMIPAKDPARLVVAPDGSVNVVGKPAPAEGAPVPLLNNAAPRTSIGNSAQNNSRSTAPQGLASGQSAVGQIVPAPSGPTHNVEAPAAPAAPVAPAAPAPAVLAAPAPAVVPSPPAAAPAVPAAPAAATPQTSNGGQVQAQGEQLVPMNISAQPPAGGAR